MSSSLLSYGKVALTTALTSALAIGGVMVLDRTDNDAETVFLGDETQLKLAALSETTPEVTPVRVFTADAPQTLLKALTANHDTPTFQAAVAPVMFETSLTGDAAPAAPESGFVEASFEAATAPDGSAWSALPTADHLEVLKPMAAPESTLSVPASLAMIDAAPLATNDRVAPLPLEQAELDHLTLDIEAMEAAFEEFEDAGETGAPIDQ